MNRLHQNHTYSPDEAAGIVVACNRIIVTNALFVTSVNNSNDKDIFSRFNNKDCHKAHWLIVVCLSAGSGVPWRPRDDDGSYGRVVSF